MGVVDGVSVGVSVGVNKSVCIDEPAPPHLSLLVDRRPDDAE